MIHRIELRTNIGCSDKIYRFTAYLDYTLGSPVRNRLILCTHDRTWSYGWAALPTTLNIFIQKTDTNYFVDKLTDRSRYARLQRTDKLLLKGMIDTLKDALAGCEHLPIKEDNYVAPPVSPDSQERKTVD